MSKQTFLQGTLILIMAGLITRFLGFINKIVVARIMGAEGVGLYMMAVPTLLLIITLTQLGLPVAISKLIAEADAENDTKKMKKILVVSLAVTGSSSIFFTIGVMAAAPFLSSFLLTDARALYPLLAIIPIVPIVALSAVLRGYFQGRQNMRPTAYSQVIEQVVRITLVAICTKAFLPYGVEYAAAGAMLSVVAGELISLLYMIWMFKAKKPMKVRKQFFSYVKGGKKTFNDLMTIALPTTGSRLVGSLSFFFEPIVVAQSLAIAGVATAAATAQYGELSGFVIPLLTLPTFITASLSVSLVPAISEAAARNDYRTIQKRLRQASRVAFISGGISVVVLYVFAAPVMDLMYNAPHAAVFLHVMAPFTIFLYFQGPLQATLQALNMAKAAMYNSLAGAIVKIGTIAVLASQPGLGIMGAALGITVSMVLVTLLHFTAVAKTISITIETREILSILVIMLGSGWAGHWFFHEALQHSLLLPRTILSLIFTVLCYVAGLFLFRIVTIKHVLRLPFFTFFQKK
ncbi:stage V sporulation protein B [Thalassorhabdus alkalitolerans]|uniref:Stage V sporulation protein B n=1 Tax=Thalassorhabdus alkalitolerans TaxID=2282697 RepID=A0ABW0YM67_9BACI